MGFFLHGLGADEFHRRVGTGNQTAECQIAEHAMNGNGRRQDIFEGDPDGTGELTGFVDAGRAHHETGHGIGGLHDGGTDHIQHDANKYVGGFWVLNHEQADGGR